MTVAAGARDGSSTASATTPERRWPRWPRLVVAVGLALALLLAGAALGLLIAPSRDASVPGADSVDVGFAQDMSVHHEQAVEMAAWERDHTTDPVLRQLAFDIETGQLAQIGRMQGWLALWQAPGQRAGPHMTWMSAGGEHAGHGSGLARMPGMATDQELAALRAASGTTLDVKFLQLMLRHHEGGVDMARYAADHATVPEVRALAAQIVAAQTAESDYMRTLLAQRGAQPLPH
ncbi:MAG: DUF305 domain-containing protein [Catenulispora sp.]